MLLICIFFLFRPNPGSSTRIEDDRLPYSKYESYENDSEDEYHPSPDEMDSELESEKELQAASFAKDDKTVTIM